MRKEREKERETAKEREKREKKQFFFVKVWKRRVYSDLNKF
jgi:hypothetical protein